MLKALNKSRIRDQKEAIEVALDNVIKYYIEENPLSQTEGIDVTLMAGTFTTMAICLFLGIHDVTAPQGEEVFKAIEEYLNYPLKESFKQINTEEEKKRFEELTDLLAGILDESYNNRTQINTLADICSKRSLTEQRTKANTVTTLTAGPENSANLLAFALWQIGRKKELFEDLKCETSLFQFLQETLRISTPAYFLPRTVAKDITVSRNYKDASNELVTDMEFEIPQGSMLCLLLTASGRDPAFFESPDEFQMRPLESYDHFFPFSKGPHVCPGKDLVEAEFKTFLKTLLERYTWESTPEKLTFNGRSSKKSTVPLIVKFKPLS